MKTIYVVRHGETTWNLQGLVQGNHDTPLSNDGLVQTTKTVASLSTVRFDAIFTSPLARARAIAEPVGANLGVAPVVMPELREIEFGNWEGHTWEEIAILYPATLATWELKSPESRPGSGESLADVHQRAERVRQMLESSSASLALVVAHGGFNRVFISVLLDLPLTSYETFAQPNACISIFEAETVKWQAKIIDSVCHLA